MHPDINSIAFENMKEYEPFISYWNKVEYIIKKLHKGEYCLLIYMLYHMKLQNRIDINEKWRQNYIMFSYPDIYTDNTVKKYLKGLVDAKLIERIQQGKYRVEPYYFWSDRVIKRIEYFKK